MKNQDITTNDLSVMVKEGFDAVDKRFDKMEKRFDSVDGRFVNLEKGQEDIRLRLDNVAYRFELEQLERRVRLLEQKQGIA